MSNQLSEIEKLLQDQPDRPPVHLWQPALSGDMDMLIKRDGSWWHEGRELQNDALRRLFASILRREEDGHYYLLTPVEKWRIRVEDKPLNVVDMDIRDEHGEQQLIFTTNVATRYLLSREYPLRYDAELTDARPYIALDNGLGATLTRAVYYRLAELSVAEQSRYFVRSAGSRFELR